MAFGFQKSNNALTRLHTFSLKSSTPTRKESMEKKEVLSFTDGKIKIESCVKETQKEQVAPPPKEKEGGEDGISPMSYYVEQQAPLLEQLISNCEPILDKMRHIVLHFRDSIGDKHPLNSEAFLKTLKESASKETAQH